MRLSIILLLSFCLCFDVQASYQKVYNYETGVGDFVGVDQLSDMQIPCVEGEILKKGASGWECAADSTAVGGGNSIYLEDSGSAEGNNASADITIDWTGLSKIDCTAQNCTVSGRDDGVQSAHVNWTDIYSGELQRAGINWSSLSQDINSAGINWDNIEVVQPITEAMIGDLGTYLTSETDPQVGTLGASGKWCSTNGTVVNCEEDAPAGSGDVTATASFGTDNVLIKSDGTGKGVQATGISVADTTNDITGAGNYSGTGALLSGLTASEILGTDASKNLVSLAVATYPSLTELSYVKGVTSAIQTQIGNLVTLSGVAGGAVHLGTFTGTTIADNQTVKQALQALETFAEGILGTDTVQTANINWDSITSGEIQSAGVNWDSLNENIQQAGINWDSIHLLQPQSGATKELCFRRDMMTAATNWDKLFRFQFDGQITKLLSYSETQGGVNWDGVIDGVYINGSNLESGPSTNEDTSFAGTATFSADDWWGVQAKQVTANENWSTCAVFQYDA